MNCGIFCFSLDFELHWGQFDKLTAAESRETYRKEIDLIPRLLKMFVDNKVRVTWAAVGALMAADRQELAANLKKIDVKYNNGKLSPQAVFDRNEIGENEKEDPIHFAGSIVRQIARTEGQELATHTYSHFYALEPGSTLDSFKRDISASIEASERFGRRPVSLIFPRNQYSAGHLRACRELGIETVRTNPDVWFWKSEAQETEGSVKKLFRMLDGYVRLAGRGSYPLSRIVPQESTMPAAMPASRFLSPFRSIDKSLIRFKRRRIMREMATAARKKEVYHLWCHPYNFVDAYGEGIKTLRIILEQFRNLHEKCGMQSMNMRQVSELLRKKSP